ncbi:MAG TPA: DHH family phosphoesterase [Anaerolineaceae bacterium]|nr:DHH family phosphoesterase [Anaerolineaceae bacterium]HPN50574.1 DHH family phosphoesterase [Anaerolineaceae bacterium]
MHNSVYVTGHVNPDTDSIASALGYAWLLRERDGTDAVAARAGAINAQTTWVLKHLQIDPPFLLTDASPRFESVMRRLDTSAPDRPLSEAWAILSRTGGVAPVVDSDGKPFGLLTGRSLITSLSKMIGPHPRRKDMRLSEFLELPCEQAVEFNVPAFQASTRIRDVLHRILREEGEEFWVLDEQGRYAGICRQRDALNPPRLKIILVDHNEPHQAVGSLEEAELLEILDHHRLGNSHTHTPIRFIVDIVGSTSTLVSEQIEDAGLSAPPAIAGVLLAGLLSDTLILHSPTTTPRDHEAAQRLSRWAFVRGSSLAGETLQSFGEKVLAASAGLRSRPANEVVSTDMKIYRAGNYQFAIAQVEVSDLYEVSGSLEALNKALSDLRDSKGLDFAMLMVTDVVRSSSRLLLSGNVPLLDELPYPPQPDGTRLAQDVVSRKKQLLPIVLSLLEN